MIDTGLDMEWTVEWKMKWNGHSKSRNEEMGKWEEGTLHFTQQTADVLLATAVIKCNEQVNVHPCTH